MPEECPDCAASFSSPSELVEHMTTAHGGGDPKASLALNPNSESHLWKCGLCGRAFGSPQSLARHNLAPHPIGTPNMARSVRRLPRPVP